MDRSLFSSNHTSWLLSVCITGGMLVGGTVVYQFCRRTKAAIVQDAILSRRTVQARYFDTTAVVPAAYIDRMLEVANWAPTHGKTEPWRFVVFESLAARRALGEKDAEIYKAITPLESFVQKKYQKKIDSKVNASYVIAIGMKRQESQKLPLVEEQIAVGCAVQNMHILASALGLGCCWLSGPTVRTDAMKEYLQFNDSVHDECLGFLCVGVPDPNNPPPAVQRKPIADKVRRV